MPSAEYHREWRKNHPHYSRDKMRAWREKHAPNKVYSDSENATGLYPRKTCLASKCYEKPHPKNYFFCPRHRRLVFEGEDFPVKCAGA